MILYEKIRYKCTKYPCHIVWAALQIEESGHSPLMVRVETCLFYPAMRAML